MKHPKNRSPSARRAGSIAVVAALCALLAACGGSDDDPAPAPVTPGSSSLSAQQISDAQGTVDTAIVPVNAASAPPSATQIESQRAALDGATTDGTATIAGNQTEMDLATGLAPAF